MWKTKHLSLRFEEGHLRELFHWLREGRDQIAVGFQEEMRRKKQRNSKYGVAL